MPLEKPTRLTEMTDGDRCFYSFGLPRPSDRLSPGVQCGLIGPSGPEIPVTVVQIDAPQGGSVVVMTEVPFTIAEGAYRLIFVPWFLYDGMLNALSEVPFPETALRAFCACSQLHQEIQSISIGKEHVENNKIDCHFDDRDVNWL